MLDYDDQRDYAEEAVNQALLDDPDPEPEEAIRASFRDPAWLRRGVRFRAFPTRTVRQDDGTYAVPVYRVTAIRRHPGSISIYYCDDADGKGKWLTTLTRLQENELEILPLSAASVLDHPEED